MICSSCGNLNAHKHNFDISKASVVNEMLRDRFPTSLDLSSSKVSQMLLDAEVDREHCDHEIFQLQARILHLESQRKLLQRHTERLKSLLSPIRRLPNELLMHIFLYCCEDLPVSLAQYEPSLGPPFILASVCIRWHQIVVEAPQLWCNLWLDVFEFVPELVSPLKMYLARSKSSPLTITISSLVEDAGVLPELLIEHSARWQKAEFETEFSELVFPTLAGKSFPELEVLTITNLYSGYPHLNLFNFAPRLHTLDINSIPPLDKLNGFPFSQITNLMLSCAAAAGAIPIELIICALFSVLLNYSPISGRLYTKILP